MCITYRNEIVMCEYLYGRCETGYNNYLKLSKKLIHGSGGGNRPCLQRPVQCGYNIEVITRHYAVLRKCLLHELVCFCFSTYLDIMLFQGSV